MLVEAEKTINFTTENDTQKYVNEGHNQNNIRLSTHLRTSFF